MLQIFGWFNLDFYWGLPEQIYSLLDELSSQKSAFSRPQTLDYKNGYALPRRSTVGVGQDPLLSEQLIQQGISDLLFETADMTYGSSDQSLVEVFIPAYVALDKKVQHGIGSVRPVFEVCCSCLTNCPITSLFVCSSPPSCLVGAALLCLLWGKYPVLPWRGVPPTACGCLLLPWGWQHVHHWAHSGEFWDTTGEADQTPATAKEWTWRALPVERPQPWHGPGGVRGQVPHHTVRCFHKGTALTCMNALAGTKMDMLL